ncbi:unnamed protein product [Musa acuminata subsp. malaccensis]|uniref:(wild Malaysian banana) hypothetical protein n=1 Tax=Musa acuminata subsp. malaccensis TaxID=214687 RepID=A0A804IJY3_MUSAM|nr:PREDICTED: uncharacterized methyltransferase At1g78140, chloroplastic isoform X3 [Musa acuminata subsp. malaccensis]CAG1840918.1 unnamed protein product [Musa acuminata subsp. malaccensis]
MTTALGNVGGVLLHLPLRHFLFNPRRSLIPKPHLLARGVVIRAATTSSSSPPGTATGDSNPVTQDLTEDAKVSTGIPILACPICYNSLISKNGPGLKLAFQSASNLECHTCKKDYQNNGIYLDLAVASGSKDYAETMPAMTELFRSPLVSFLYERGWRQNFVWGGFPGPEREFEMAKGYLKPSTGGTIIDASCGSGLFSRLFAKSGMFSLVIALDFSENMLQQCYNFINQEGMPRENLILVRADISRLPFVSSSVDAVHAGAAIHCWPSPSAGVAEISRVLRPGGVFVATTFILDVLPPVIPILKTVRQYYIRASSNYLYLSEGELEDLCQTCGLVNFTCVRNGPFVMISATKPS